MTIPKWANAGPAATRIKTSKQPKKAPLFITTSFSKNFSLPPKKEPRGLAPSGDPNLRGSIFVVLKVSR
jgi:hypothetical protein